MKKPTSIAIMVVIVVICLVGYFASISLTKTTTSLPDTGKRETEMGGPKTVNITNVSELSDILLPSQVLAVRSQISSFLLDYLDPNTTSAAIIGSVTVNNDGSVSFVVQSKAPAGKSYEFTQVNPNSDYTSGPTIRGRSKEINTFNVLLNRDNVASITVSIKEYNYIAVVPLVSE